MIKRIAGIMVGVSACLLFITATPAHAQSDVYLASYTGVWAKYNPTASIWRSASGTATEITWNCLNSDCTKFELVDVGTGSCVEYVSGTGVTNATCTGDPRESWEIIQCTNYPNGDYLFENVYFGEDLVATAVGTSLTLGSPDCVANQTWSFSATGP